MIRARARLRSVTQPVLAFLAAAGLFVGSGPGAVVNPIAPVVPGQAALTTAEYAQPAALSSGGVAVPGGVMAEGKRQQPRGDGADAARFQPRGTGAIPVRPARPGSGRAADPAAIHVLFLAMSGRDSAPPTAPPSFPS